MKTFLPSPKGDLIEYFFGPVEVFFGAVFFRQRATLKKMCLVKMYRLHLDKFSRHEKKLERSSFGFFGTGMFSEKALYDILSFNNCFLFRVTECNGNCPCQNFRCKNSFKSDVALKHAQGERPARKAIQKIRNRRPRRTNARDDRKDVYFVCRTRYCAHP